MKDMDLTNYSEVVELVSSIVKEKLNQNTSLLSLDGGIPLGVSNRHIHVSREVVDVLFGKGYQLNKLKDLTQPGEFSAKETVIIVGPKMRPIERVRILGPERDITQVELSHTDGFRLGIELPVRISGDIEGTPGFTVIGPKGSVSLKKGAIKSARHIHMTPEDAEHYQVKNGDIVSVEIPGDSGLILKNVHIRISKNYSLELHIDTDEGNAANTCCGALCRII